MQTQKLSEQEIRQSWQTCTVAMHLHVLVTRYSLYATSLIKFYEMIFAEEDKTFIKKQYSSKRWVIGE